MFQGTTTELWSIMCPIVEIIVYNQRCSWTLYHSKWATPFSLLPFLRLNFLNHRNFILSSSQFSYSKFFFKSWSLLSFPLKNLAI
jgi:hypothetical protein